MGFDPFSEESDSYVDVNGDVVRAEDATVSIFDRNFLYGDGVFESMPVYEGKMLMCDRHLDRLFRSLKAVQMSFPLARGELVSRMRRVASKSDLEYGSIRVMVSRGQGPPGVVNADRVSDPTVVVVPQPSAEGEVAYGRDVPATGSARIVSTRAIQPDSVDSKVKSHNYLVNVLAERELVGTDADFGIMLDHDGYVAEEFVSNVFIRDEDGTFRTPPTTHALAGITRELVMEVGSERGEMVVESRLTPYDLYTAEDVFVTASARGIASLVELNGQPIGDGEQSQAVIDLARATFDYALNNEFTPIADDD
jgi:branched-chain amino acid aminotransferase